MKYKDKKLGRYLLGVHPLHDHELSQRLKNRNHKNKKIITIKAKFSSTCLGCSLPINQGQWIRWHTEQKKAKHTWCLADSG